jgi:hypothetical protein
MKTAEEMWLERKDIERANYNNRKAIMRKRKIITELYAQQEFQKKEIMKIEAEIMANQRKFEDLGIQIKNIKNQ